MLAEKWGGWREPIDTKSEGTTHTERSEVVPEGQRWLLQRVAVKNDTTNGAACVVSIERGAYPYTIHPFTSLTNGVWSEEKIEEWLYPMERVRFDWSGVVATEGLHMHLLGSRRFEAKAVKPTE
jgi:hypothetical protein